MFLVLRGGSENSNLSQFKRFPKLGTRGGVVKFQIFPKFKRVQIILGVGGGAKKIVDFFPFLGLIYLGLSPNGPEFCGRGWIKQGSAKSASLTLCFYAFPFWHQICHFSQRLHVLTCLELECKYMSIWEPKYIHKTAEKQPKAHMYCH